MSHHHGMTSLKGIHAFCRYGHQGARGDRFGRLFDLPPLYVRPDQLRQIGQPGGPMDGGSASDRTNSVPVGTVFFGQFIDHDITLDVTSSLAEVNDESETPNVRTPTLDLDSVYGSGPEASPHLYHGSGEFGGVKFLTGADSTAAQVDGGPQPHDLAASDLSRTAHGTALIGDPRNDENRIISQMHLAMLRFHNHVVDTLHGGAQNGEAVTGHELYESARRLTTWHYQWTVVEDFLSAMCGRAVVADILGNGRRFFCSDTDVPFIPIEFSVAAYRFGHSMIPQRIHIQRSNPTHHVFGPTLGHGFSPLGSPAAVVDWYELAATSADRNVQMAEKLDSKLAPDLLDLPFIQPPAEASLATRNLLRGQAFLLPSGEQIARAMERPSDEIDNVSTAAQNMAGSDIDLSSGTPLWFYLLVEAERIGRETEPGLFEEREGLGPVGARIVAETLIGLLELDGRSYLAQNRSWHPSDGVGVATLGEMLTYEVPQPDPAMA